MSAYYCCPIETVIRSLLPQVVRRHRSAGKNSYSFSPIEQLRQKK